MFPRAAHAPALRPCFSAAKVEAAEIGILTAMVMDDLRTAQVEFHESAAVGEQDRDRISYGLDFVGSFGRKRPVAVTDLPLFFKGRVRKNSLAFEIENAAGAVVDDFPVHAPDTQEGIKNRRLFLHGRGCYFQVLAST